MIQAFNKIFKMLSATTNILYAFNMLQALCLVVYMYFLL